jgi:hypothetical protein
MVRGCEEYCDIVPTFAMIKRIKCGSNQLDFVINQLGQNTVSERARKEGAN